MEQLISPALYLKINKKTVVHVVFFLIFFFKSANETSHESSCLSRELTIPPFPSSTHIHFTVTVFLETTKFHAHLRSHSPSTGDTFSILGHLNSILTGFLVSTFALGCPFSRE